ncbi:hypothetical protein [Desulfuromonas sp. AOP6]|uniref:hypothetical protein n=1 Tax=Desulfuromonas sp. AOP6 TaxID=1566351 RepID=UPI0012873766|nr:hypothetical protein [Desulfuromonas sp. AOP6]BCA78590.1 lipoprotein [Desulfuromonas sp. AOP6]
MRRMSLLLIFVLLAGCGGGYFKVPKEEYQARVRTLGVLPLLVDERASLRHPDEGLIFELLQRENAGKEELLVEELRAQKAYFDVRRIDGHPQDLFYGLVRGSSLGGQGKTSYRRYAFDAEAVRNLTDGHVVDGLLVVVLNGLQRPEKRWDRTRLKYLEADYSAIQVSAAVVTPTGEVIWEYPSPPGSEFLPLQYPDFDEAHYNMAEAVAIKDISVKGLRRALQERTGGLLGKGKDPLLYRKLFSDLAGQLQPATFQLPGKTAAEPAPPTGSQARP